MAIFYSKLLVYRVNRMYWDGIGYVTSDGGDDDDDDEDDDDDDFDDDFRSQLWHSLRL